VELEDSPTLSRCAGIVQIDTIDEPNELDTEGFASRERSRHVAKESYSLCRVQFGRTYFFFAAAHRDGSRGFNTEKTHRGGMMESTPATGAALPI
jgi:hypothetical protein